VLRYLGVRLLVPADDIAGDLRVNQAGVDRVHADAVLDVFQSGRPRQADHAVLGRDVGTDTGLPVNAPTDALLTIAPLPCRSICRSSYFMQLHTPRKLIPSRGPTLAGAVGRRGDAGHYSRVVERGVEPAELGTVRSTIAATWASSLTSHRKAIAL